MQAATDLIATTAKFAARVQNSHHHFKCGEARPLMMFLYWDAASVVFYGDRTVSMNRHLHCVAIASHHLVDTIIDNLVNQVMQTALIGSADIHTRAHPHSLKAFENLDVLLAVIAIPVAGYSPLTIPTFIL